MKIFLDTADIKEIREAAAMGIADGVTTNPSLVAKTGRKYDDVSKDGMELIQQVVTIYKNYGYKTQVLVASVRNPVHVVRAAMMGADIATLPFAVVQQLMKHPLTDIGIEKFLADWKKVPQ